MQYCPAPKPAPRVPQLQSGLVCGMNSSHRADPFHPHGASGLYLDSCPSLQNVSSHKAASGVPAVPGSSSVLIFRPGGWGAKREMPDPGLRGGGSGLEPQDGLSHRFNLRDIA